MLKEFGEVCRRKAYAKRSKAVSDALREFVSNAAMSAGGEKIAAITLLYGHEARGISDALTRVQHKHGVIISSSLHVHLGSDCLEVIVAQGDGRKIDALANELATLRGVKHCKMSAFAATHAHPHIHE